MRPLRIAVLLLAIPARAAFALSLLPLDTEDAALLPTGNLELSLGFRYLDHTRPPFRNVERDQWSAPELGVSAGLGSRAEVQFRWEAVYARNISPDTGFRRYDTGDARLFTKVRVTSAGDFRQSWVPETALRFGLKLPNAGFNGGLGTDQADFLGAVLAARDLPGIRLEVNLGIGILGNPGVTRGQDDVLLYQLAGVSPAIAKWRDVRVAFLGELGGIESSRFGNEQRYLGIGVRLRQGLLAGYLGATAPVSSGAEDFGVRFGMIWWLEAYSEP